MEKDLETALDKAVIIVDSMEEIHRIASIGERLGKTIEIGIRINPNFTLDGDECMFNKFGIDEEQVEEYLKDNQYPHLKVTGVHVHLKSQELDTNVMVRYYKKMFELARKYVELLGNLEYVNLGSGMGVEYALEDEAIDVEHLGGLVKSEMEAFKEANPNTQIMIETGRYVTCKSGVYVTKVIDRKVSCGKTILIIKNTLTGFARPCYEQVITRIGGDDAPSAEPLFTKASAFQFDTLKKGPLERVSIFGNYTNAVFITRKAGRSFHNKRGGDSMLKKIIEYNKTFAEKGRGAYYATSKYPNRNLAIVTCMDTRLTEMLPAALGIKNGDAKIIKDAGGMIVHPFGAVVRSFPQYEILWNRL